MGMWAFLGSECMFFGSLIGTYLAYKGKSINGPGPHEILNIPLTSVSAFVLLMSSLLMVLALAAVQRNDMKWGKIWLFLTAVFGAGFVGFQIFEFTHFVHLGLTLQTNLFGSTFFVLTGFHGAHVTGGVIWLLAGQARPAGLAQGRDLRPLLALRRHRVDRHLRPGLLDPVGG
jgi:heme/copper-type cytochrome/quinol oxidase subunit 3